MELHPSSMYQVSMFLSRTRMSLTVTVTLPPGFPGVAPVFSVEPPMSHPWVDQKMDVVGHPMLMAWNGSIAVGKLLKDVELELSLRPPALLTSSPQLRQSDTQGGAQGGSQAGHGDSAKPVSFPEVETMTYRATCS